MCPQPGSLYFSKFSFQHIGPVYPGYSKQPEGFNPGPLVVQGTPRVEGSYGFSKHLLNGAKYPNLNSKIGAVSYLQSSEGLH